MGKSEPFMGKSLGLHGDSNLGVLITRNNQYRVNLGIISDRIQIQIMCLLLRLHFSMFVLTNWITLHFPMFVLTN